MKKKVAIEITQLADGVEFEVFIVQPDGSRISCTTASDELISSNILLLNLAEKIFEPIPFTKKGEKSDEQ